MRYQMTKEIQPTEGKTLFIPKAELIAHGCRNCVWRLHKQCPYDIKEGYYKDDGICDEFSDFLMSFAEGSGSISAVWEKFNLYLSRLQSLEDYKEFKLLEAEIAEMEKGNSATIDKEQLAKLDMKRNAMKLWWAKLNEQVTKGLARIVDREQKVTGGEVSQLTIQQLNLHINNAAQQLASIEAKEVKEIEQEEGKDESI